MRAAWLCAQVDLRRRWKSGLALMLLVGLASAVVLAAAAGARRTESSFDRFLAESRVSDAYLFPGEVTKQQLREFADVPYIEALGTGQTLQVVDADGNFLNAAALTDHHFFNDLERPRIVAGRAADPGAVHEVVVPEPLADQRHLGVGDTLALHSFTPEQIDQLKSGELTSFDSPEGPDLRLHVVGISRLPSDLSLSGADGGILFFTRAFGERYGTEIGSYSGDVFGVRLRHGDAEVPRLIRRARTFFGTADTFDVSPGGQNTAGVQESVDVLALGSAIFAAVAAIASLTAMALVLRRRVDAESGDVESLRSLGMTRRERALGAALTAVPIAVGGALLGVLGAWLASPLLPMGLARDAEPDPGMHFDALVLMLGFLATVGLLLTFTAVIAWRSARVRSTVASATTRTSALARVSESIGIAPPVSIGVRLGLEGRAGRSGVPVRSALIGTMAAVLGIVGVGVFATSLHHLEQTPALYGFNWDARVLGNVTESEAPNRPCTAVESSLTSVRGVAGVASICSTNVAVGGRPMAAFGFSSIRGTIEPTIVEGRAPRRATEVAVGTNALAELGLEIGDTVEVQAPTTQASYRIVGTAAAPQFEDEFSDLAPVDDAAFFIGDGLDRLHDERDSDSNVESVIRVAVGADRDAVLRRVEHVPGVEAFGGGPGVATATFPLELRRLSDVDLLPLALGGFLAVLGIVSVGFVLASSVRRRSRDLAILKTLGFSRRQVSATVAWQATTIAVVGLIVGVPFGVVIGRAIWQSVAEGIGVASTPHVVVLVLVAVVLATIALANLVAAAPAWAAARTRPALVLRSE